jgi:selenide,water dikinase
LNIRAADVPFMPSTADLVKSGCVTGASHRNWSSYGHEVMLPDGYQEWQRHLLTDPQTSGGLLVAVASEAAQAILQTVIAAGYPFASIIGHVEAGPAAVRITD